MRKKLLSILALLCLTVTSARADWTGGTYTATATENLGAITVNGDATLTINEGMTVTVNNGLTIAEGKTLTVTGPGTLVVTGNDGNGGNGGMDGGTGGTGGVAISGNIIVQGGATVTATGGNGGNGGNGGYGDCFGGNGGNGGNAFAGTLTYKSGTVTANGGSGGSGGLNEDEEYASNGSAGNAFASNSVTLVNTPTTLTGDGSDITIVTNPTVTGYQTVNISGPVVIYNVTANQVGDVYWSTFYSNEGNYQAPEGTQVFAVNLNTSTAKITMTEISDRIVKSGEGVVLKKTTTGSFTMTKTATAPAGDFSSNSLTGTMNSITNPGNAYVLNGTNGVGFYKLKTTGTIGANKAYLTYSGALAPEFFSFGETTSISEIEKMRNVENETFYDLQGRRVAQPTKGLYIVNGKKVVIK